PLDTNAVELAAKQHKLIVTIEDNAIAGGAGSAVSEHLNKENVTVNLLQIGFPDELIKHGDPGEMLTDWNLDKTGIMQTIKNRMNTSIAP
ncbi:MAG: 1-deoxy-D-xylulose-5-phosphate synthase, partial [Gammaproteobacteria bacterium]